MDLLKLKNNKSGYTLLEVLVSFAIFTILLGIIVFGFRNARSIEEFKESTSLFVSHIKQIQNWALTGKEIEKEGIEVPIGGYGIYMNLFKNDRYIIFADRGSVNSDTQECILGVGNQRYDNENFKNFLPPKCTYDASVGMEKVFFGQDIIFAKVVINYSSSEEPRVILTGPSYNPGEKKALQDADIVLDIAFQNFKPFPYIGIEGSRVGRDPNSEHFNSRKINTLEIYFLQQNLSICRKVTIFGSSGLVQEESTPCPVDLDL